MNAEPRLASLDALRGFAIASMVLVNNPGDWSHLYAPLVHAKWHGWTFTDIVFPLFLFAAGMSLAISIDRRKREGASPRELLANALRRALVIFLVGLALNFIPAFDPSHVRIPGVLQRIALCLAIAAPVVIRGGSRAALVAIVLLCTAYAVAMLLVPVEGADGLVAAGRLEPGNDFGAWVDRHVFGDHVWSQSRTWDPEGLVSTLPAVASLLFGVIAANALARCGRDAKRAWLIAMAGAIFLTIGAALDAFFMPINKNLWTPSYAVFMTGWSLLILAIFDALQDRLRAAFPPLTIFGMNALFIFAFSGLVARLLSIGGASSIKASLYAPIRALPWSAENASLAYAVLFGIAMFAVAWFLWKKRWFIKA
jgi:predicted acyltransferase